MCHRAEDSSPTGALSALAGGGNLAVKRNLREFAIISGRQCSWEAYIVYNPAWMKADKQHHARLLKKFGVRPATVDCTALTAACT